MPILFFGAKAMLELRPTCEQCNTALPPVSTEAMICTFECTFCRNCVETVLDNVCPNCGGGFCQRPVRPAIARRKNLSVAGYPPSGQVVFKPVDKQAHREFARLIAVISPEDR
jgi:hypothetical protein